MGKSLNGVLPIRRGYYTWAKRAMENILTVYMEFGISNSLLEVATITGCDLYQSRNSADSRLQEIYYNFQNLQSPIASVCNQQKKDQKSTLAY